MHPDPRVQRGRQLEWVSSHPLLCVYSSLRESAPVSPVSDESGVFVLSLIRYSFRKRIFIRELAYRERLNYNKTISPLALPPTPVEVAFWSRFRWLALGEWRIPRPNQCHQGSLFQELFCDVRQPSKQQLSGGSEGKVSVKRPKRDWQCRSPTVLPLTDYFINKWIFVGWRCTYYCWYLS